MLVTWDIGKVGRIISIEVLPYIEFRKTTFNSPFIAIINCTASLNKNDINKVFYIPIEKFTCTNF